MIRERGEEDEARPPPEEGPKTSLEPEKEDDAERRSSPSALIVHEAIRLEGEEELKRSPSSVGWSGLAAGMTMGFSLMAQGILHAALPDTAWRELIVSFGYTMGFLFVTLGRQQLYTETTLTVTLPLLHDRRHAVGVLRFWAIVFATNMVGTILFAWAATLPALFAEDVRSAFLEIGMRAASGSFGDVVLRGVLAGWLIALMVWLLPAAQTARFFVIIVVTYLIAIAGLAHVVAGSVDVAFAAASGAVSWGHYAFGFILPALIGNTIGGVALVAVLNHAQVKDEA